MSRIPPLLAPRGSIGGGAAPVVMGASTWWSADAGHDRSTTIASWRDCIQGLELTAAGAARPSYDVSGCGGRASISFDGVAEYMTITGRPALNLGTGAAIYGVFASAETTQFACLASRYTGTGLTSPWWMLAAYDAGAANGQAAMGETGTGTTRASNHAGSANAVTDPTSGTAVRTMMLRWTGSQISLITSRVAASVTACAGAVSDDATPMEVGRIFVGANVYTDMRLRHLMIFARDLGTDERAYLADWATADCGAP